MQTKAGFKALLNENNVVVCDRTIEKILQSHSARLLLCVEFGEALALYMEVDRLPQTTTLELLKEQCVFLDGIFFQNTKTTIFNALSKGVPRMFKIPKTEAEVNHEAGVWDGLVSASVDLSHLVPLESILLTTTKQLESFVYNEVERQSVRFGLLMPKYAQVLSDFKEVDVITITNWMTQAIRALEQMHKASYVHCDVKPANFFLNETGVLFLGDYGAAVKEGTPFKEFSPAYMPSDSGNVPLRDIDYFSLALTALELTGNWTPGTTVNKAEIKHMVEVRLVGDLKEMIVAKLNMN